MPNEKPRGQGPPYPKRKYIRLPPDTYKNPSNTFSIVIDALDRQKHFADAEFNDQVVAVLRDLVLLYRCPTRIYCLMPTHLHLLVRPGIRSLVDVIAEFKKKTADLASETQGIKPLWQRSFFDHRVRSHESEAEQYEYIRFNPVRAGLVCHPDDWRWTGSVDW